MNYLQKKVRASSMYYALFLSMVIAVILAGMVLYSGMNRQFTSELDIESLLRSNADSGIEYGMAFASEIPVQTPVHIRLFGEGIDSVHIARKRWGVFSVIESTATHQGKESTRIALVGNGQLKSLCNVYVVDLGRPISICGDTRLEGKIAMPESGLKRAYIEGKNYTGTSMHYGHIISSSRNLPPLNLALQKEYQTYSGELIPWSDELDSLQVSFSENAIHLISDRPIDLTGKSIRGQVILESRDSIFVGSDSELEQVILKSPVVHFQQGFSGEVQVLASKKIYLEEEVILKYPSVLSLVEDEFPTEISSCIHLEDDCQVLGTVILYSQAENFRKPITLYISPMAEIDGLVYNAGRTQLQGTVVGHLYTQKLHLETAASTYENHILDGKVLNELPENFCAVQLFENANQLTRLKWLQ